MPLGVTLDAPIARLSAAGSPWESVRGSAHAAVPGADIAAINSAGRGLRAGLGEDR
jgi:hypothetical protein